MSSALMEKHEANPYKEILTYICGTLGSINEGLKVVGITQDDYTKLFEQNQIQIQAARKILNAYSSLKG